MLTESLQYLVTSSNGHAITFAKGHHIHVLALISDDSSRLPFLWWWGGSADVLLPPRTRSSSCARKRCTTPPHPPPHPRRESDFNFKRWAGSGVCSWHVLRTMNHQAWPPTACRTRAGTLAPRTFELPSITDIEFAKNVSQKKNSRLLRTHCVTNTLCCRWHPLRS